jgi:hypothetical protein
MNLLEENRPMTKVSIYKADNCDSESMEWDDAVEEVQKLLDMDDDTWLWEVRAAGVDFDDTWNSGEYETFYLAEALDMAMPRWEDAGLDQAVAIVLAMSLELILATGLDKEHYALEDQWP